MKCPKCNAETSADSLYCHKCGSNLSTKVRENTSTETKDFGKEISFFSPGDSFGNRYRIIEELGRGGMGRVYKARDKVLNTVVALKMVRPEFLSDKRMVQRFKREILLAREITHENVVRIYDFGEEKEVKFISMQYIEGQSLKELIENSGPLPFERIKDIIKKICRGLRAAHNRDIVHRDLKPQNIMIDKNDRVYITDFGLAVSSDSPIINHPDFVVGTPQYMAPEQWMGEKIDRRTDIYTLGIIMFEMITGCGPFVSDSDIGYFQKHLKEKPVFPKVLYVKVPGYFKKIIKKCLEKRKEYRYQDAEEVIADIDAGVFKRDFIASRLRKRWIFRNVAALLLIVSALYGIYRLIDSMKKKETLVDPATQRSIAILPFSNPSGDQSGEHLRNSLFFLLHTDLSQSKFLRVLPEHRLHDILKEIRTGNDNLYSTETYEKISSIAKVEFIIKGSFLKSGGQLRITASIWNSRRKHETAATSVDTQENILFPAVDRLTLKIKKQIDFSRRELYLDSEMDKAVATFASTSKEAFDLYVEGKVKLNDEAYKESIVFFRKAIEKDPGFAMAYKEIAWAYALVPDIPKRREFYRLAMEHSMNLPEKEKLLIAGYYYAEDEKTHYKAVASFQKILKIYLEDYEANYQLGNLFFNVEEWDRAIEYYKKADIGTNPDPQFYASRVFAYMKTGQVNRAREIIDNYHNIFSKKVRLLKFKYDTYIVRKNFEQAAVTREEIKTLTGGNNIYDGEIDFYKGDLKKAEKKFIGMMRQGDKQSAIEGALNLKELFLLEGKFAKAIELLNEGINRLSDPDYKIMRVFDLAFLYLRSGKPESALAEIEKHLKGREKELWPHQLKMKAFYKCLIYLETGQKKNLAGSLADLKQRTGNSIFRKDVKYYHYVMGKIEQKKGNQNQAVLQFEKAASFLPCEARDDYYVNQHAQFLNELAAAYYKAGNMDEAGKHFNRITGLTFGRFYFGDLYAKSYYFLGKIDQDRGRKGKAIEKFETFLRLWQEADPVCREKEIRDARKQLEILKD